MLGRNGAGKSTTLGTVMGWLKPRAGQIAVFGEQIGGLAPELIVEKGVALVPQALKATALADTVFIPLSDPGAPYDTYCLWKTASTHPALAAFVDTVRAGVQGG